MTNEEIQKLVQERVQSLAREPIASDKDVQKLAVCLSHLEPEKYCIEYDRNKNYHIRLSRRTLEDIVSLGEGKVLIYRIDDIREDLHKDRVVCETIIKVLSNLADQQEAEEERKIKKRIALEEEERDKYRRRY